MENHISTAPFGSRPLTLAQVASSAASNTRPLDKAVHKWNVFRAICTARVALGVTERALAVLNALLTFHPETVLSGGSLVVFPSNEQLSMRAHGMAPATLRRHLGALVASGLILRRDSPNGKRYARKGRDGEVEIAFGFDLGPLVARVDEFEASAETVRAEERALRSVRERITICRRELAKGIEACVAEGVPAPEGGQGGVAWASVFAQYREIVARIPRTATRLEFEPIADALGSLADDVLSRLERHAEATNTSANESQVERHIHNSNPNTFIDLEPSLPKRLGAKAEPTGEDTRRPSASFSLAMVLGACPDIRDYAKGDIPNWREFLATAASVRPMLGISPSAWQAAVDGMGEQQAAVVVAAILQKGAAISSAGGYLRDLTRRAGEGSFSLGPMLMALLSSRTGKRERA